MVAKEKPPKYYVYEAKIFEEYAENIYHFTHEHDDILGEIERSLQIAETWHGQD